MFLFNSLSVAKALYDMYFDENKEEMDEVRMHMLMYLAQRESLLAVNCVIFDELFYGWKYGPVLRSVHTEYKKADKFNSVEELKSLDVLYLLSNVLIRYGKMSLWSLSELFHNELSWKFSRLGLAADESGYMPLSLKLMQEDANREKGRRLQTKKIDEKQKNTEDKDLENINIEEWRPQSFGNQHRRNRHADK